MKIVFLCGSLEPGKDGVGDYIRRIAGELVYGGHQVAAVALYDVFIKKESSSIQNVEGNQLPVLRLGSSCPAKNRFLKAKQWIDEFNPDWLSLQFVPFAFHPKGVPIGLNSMLAELGKGRRWHIMFHELWVGMDVQASKKFRIWGFVQRQLIKSLISKLQAEVIHTQAKLYQMHLAKLGYSAEYLPLFSNIPVVGSTDLNGKDCLSSKLVSGAYLVAFGTLHPGAPAKKIAREIALYTKEKGDALSLVLLGRCGSEKDMWVESWKSEGLKVVDLGEQPTAVISQVLGQASVGISTTPFFLAEKSGSVAAMLSHRLPVLCVSRRWEPRGKKQWESLRGVFDLEKQGFDACLKMKVNSLSTPSPAEVARQFSNTLLSLR